VRDRPGWSYAVITPELTGAFETINGDDVSLFHVNLAPSETVEDFHREALRGDDPRRGRRR
jgi:hypothetical protein